VSPFVIGLPCRQEKNNLTTKKTKQWFSSDGHGMGGDVWFFEKDL